MSKLIVICLVGAPCSGKSTWVDNNIALINERHKCPVIVISRDQIRETMFGKKYVMNPIDEGKVTKKFYEQLSTCSTLEDAVLILDNCHMKHSYIKEYTFIFRRLINVDKLEFYIEFFQIPYWKAVIRNYKRKLATGKWIPVKVMKGFYKQYDYLMLDNHPKYSEKYGK